MLPNPCWSKYYECGVLYLLHFNMKYMGSRDVAARPRLACASRRTGGIQALAVAVQS